MINLWQCSYCTMSSTSELKVATHEMNCDHRGSSKHCNTCIFHIDLDWPSLSCCGKDMAQYDSVYYDNEPCSGHIVHVRTLLDNLVSILQVELRVLDTHDMLLMMTDDLVATVSIKDTKLLIQLENSEWVIGNNDDMIRASTDMITYLNNQGNKFEV